MFSTSKTLLKISILEEFLSKKYYKNNNNNNVELSLFFPCLVSKIRLLTTVIVEPKKNLFL